MSWEGGEGGDILNNTLFRVKKPTFFQPVGGVPVEFKGYRKHFSRVLGELEMPKVGGFTLLIG
jgi:hypothetical protein